MAILEAEGLVKQYPRDKQWWKFWDLKAVVDGVNFKVDRGEVVGLLGPNGAGKTTSFRMVTGQVEPNGGRVTFMGQDVTGLPMFRRARLGMGYLPQDHSIFKKLNIEENVLAVLELIPSHPRYGRKPNRKERYDLTDEVLTKFGLIEKRYRNSATLSGGERRRLEIARCLVTEPSLILMDEPFVGIDPPTVNDIKNIIADLRKQNIAILITDHQVREVLQVADRGYIIVEGKVIAEGTPAELARNKTAVEVYIQHTIDGLKFAQQQGATVDAGRGGVMIGDVVAQARTQTLLDRLRTHDFNQAAADLIGMGAAAIPALVEALQWPNMEMRRRAYEVLRRLWPDVTFDPFAPELDRHEQLGSLRAALYRRAAG